MAQAGGGLGLALGARSGLPFARHDLERDVELRLLVAGEPDRARSAAAERLERPVAAEHELGEGEGLGGLGHALGRLAFAPDCPSLNLRLNDHAPAGRAGCVRCKDAGSLDSSAIEGTEDAAACVHSAFRRPVLLLVEVLSREPE